MVRVSAPGKLFLLGEYAVLECAPALLTAVDRRAVVTATPSTVWSLTTTGIELDTLFLEADGSLPPRLDAPTRSRLGLFDAVRSGVDAHLGERGPRLELTVDSSAFLHDGHKLGLGSSAAVAVALTAALLHVRGHESEPATVFALADAAHRAAQGGSGSGGDVAASVYGGAILYRRNEPPEAVTLPEGLRVFAVSTGTGSSTVELVGLVDRYRRHSPESYRKDMDALVRLSWSVGEALTTADRLLSLADDYFHALEALSHNSGAGIVTERHREYRELAAASGAVFKSSGAGGGDLGLVFAKLESVDALQSAFTESGALVIPVPNSSDGVRIDPA
jgi:phosphomevalonate kinase